MADEQQNEKHSAPLVDPVRLIGGILLVVGLALYQGNRTGAFPTFPYSGTIVGIVGALMLAGLPGIRNKQGEYVASSSSGGGSDDDSPAIEVNLRHPAVAAFWAWLLPGAGHFYQRRYAKGVIFMVCILFTYFFGLALGGGRVVYASFERNDFRWQYVLQLGVGAPALPALVQSYRVRNNKEPLWPYWMSPPADVDPEKRDELADWHYQYHGFFDKGELYTMIAGLLNVLAIYDAYAGPLIIVPPERDRGPPDKKKKNGKDDSSGDDDSGDDGDQA